MSYLHNWWKLSRTSSPFRGILARRDPAATQSHDHPAGLTHRAHLDLGDARQGDLDTWLSSEQVTCRHAAGHFVRWAKRQKLNTLDFAATKRAARTATSAARPDGNRHAACCTTRASNPDDRVAGLLVPLYVQWPAAISRLTLDHVHADEQQTRLRLGREPVVPSRVRSFLCEDKS